MVASTLFAILIFLNINIKGANNVSKLWLFLSQLWVSLEIYYPDLPFLLRTLEASLILRFKNHLLTQTLYNSSICYLKPFLVFLWQISSDISSFSVEKRKLNNSIDNKI